MSELLQRRAFLIKERLHYFPIARPYEIIDLTTHEVVRSAQERPLNPTSESLRFVWGSEGIPTTLDVFENDGERLLTVQSLRTQARWTYTVDDSGGEVLGSYRATRAGEYDLLDNAWTRLGRLRGEFTGWHYAFTDMDRKRLARLTKKWAGLKRYVTSTHPFTLEIDASVLDQRLKKRLLAAAFCVELDDWGNSWIAY